MAGYQRRKLLNGSAKPESCSSEVSRARKKQAKPAEDCFNTKSHVTLEWDVNKKRVIAIKEQVGISWRSLRPFFDSLPRGREILADTFDIPRELFDLDNLEEVLSQEVWQTCLSESERKYLMQFLPVETEVQQIVKPLFAGNNFHFGNPLLQWGASLRSGNMHPDAVVARERILKAEKKAYYADLRKYHNESKKDVRRKFSLSSNGFAVEEGVAASSESSSWVADERTDNHHSAVKKGGKSRARLGPTSMITTRGVPIAPASIEVQRNQMTLKSHGAQQPGDVSAYSARLGPTNMMNNHGVPLTSSSDIWQPVSVLHSGYSSAAGFSNSCTTELTLPETLIRSEHQGQWNGVECCLPEDAAILQGQTNQGSLKHYPEQDQNDLLQSIRESEGHHQQQQLGKGNPNEMEERAQRRIHTLRNHLLHPIPPITICSLLETVSVRAERLKEVSSLGNPVVIGGMVLDIHAVPSSSIAPRTTTPGKVIYIRGGVARNIADCMSKLGTEPFMISALGLDMAGSMLLEHWKSLGLPVEGICQSQNVATAVVCCMFDSDGEVSGGVASFEAVEKFLTPEWIQRFNHKISSAPMAILDGNLNLAAIEASCRMAAKSSVPLWFEPVSVVKSRKIASVAKYVTYTSPNADELFAMAHVLSPESQLNSIQPYEDPKKESPESLFLKLKPAIGVLLLKGIDLVVVTLGPNGVFLCSKGEGNFTRTLSKQATQSGINEQLYSIVEKSCPLHAFDDDAKLKSTGSEFLAIHLPGLPASVKRLTGAGDCLVGATVASICSGLNIVQATSVGIAVAKATVEDVANVPSAFHFRRITGDAIAVFHSAKVL